MNNIGTQEEWFSRAKQVLPAGGFGNFDHHMIMKEAKGSHIWDQNGIKYIDYLIGSGPMLLGHGHPEVLDAVSEQISRGMTFFANNASGIELAEEIKKAVPCAEYVRYVTSGGEADMYAIRLARAFTGKQKILKFEGGYHGMSAEAQMSLAPSRLQNFPMAVPDSAGIPSSVRDEMVISQFNDFDITKSLLDEYEGDLAAIIVEPLQRIIPPLDGFLQFLRDECTKRNIILIFDEIVTGFRFAYGGAQSLYGVSPDLCSLGKIIGGGFPLAAVAGKSDIMAHFDKEKVGQEGFLMQLGTLSGNPVAAVAGLKTMEILRREGSYEKLRSIGKRLMDGAKTALDDLGIAHRVVGDPALFDILFIDRDVHNYRDTLSADQKKSTTFNKVLRERGIFKAGAKMYPCLALDEQDLEHTILAFREGAIALGQ